MQIFSGVYLKKCVSPNNIMDTIQEGSWILKIDQLTLQAPISHNGQTHSHNSSANCQRIV